MFSILNEIQNNSHFRTTSVTVTSIGTAGSMYLLVAITGYLSFGDNVPGNIVSACKLSHSQSTKKIMTSIQMSPQSHQLLEGQQLLS